MCVCVCTYVYAHLALIISDSTGKLFKEIKRYKQNVHVCFQIERTLGYYILTGSYSFLGGGGGGWLFLSFFFGGGLKLRMIPLSFLLGEIYAG